jgi:hypothetical protein
MAPGLIFGPAGAVVTGLFTAAALGAGMFAVKEKVECDAEAKGV